MRLSAVALVRPSHQLDDFFQILRHWHIGDLFADTADAVISLVMCSSISWNMAMPQAESDGVEYSELGHAGYPGWLHVASAGGQREPMSV